MLFNSVIFFIFAAGFFAFWPWIKRYRNPRWIYLTLASFVFYGWWDWDYLLLIIASGLIDFICGLAMVKANERRRRLLLVVSLVANLGLLASFKYSLFLATNLDALFGQLGWTTHLRAAVPGPMRTLPVGISFYTFQSLSYTIDVYRGRLTPTRNLFHFFAFLSLFPQLVAGPIVRASHLLPQLLDAPPTTPSVRMEALRHVVRGFFKKVVIADQLAPFVTNAFRFGDRGEPALFWWLVMLMFAVQIYCDFSGYSDIAIGLTKFMGYELRENFNHPYVSMDLQDFWRRWHISLSTWFRDYVYIPLGGSHLGTVRTYVNLWITMLVSGLWHGAAWTFVIWGAVHAAALTVERVTGWPKLLQKTLPGRLLSWALTLIIVLVAWVFFRATSLSQSVDIVTAMFSPRWGSFEVPLVAWFLVPIVISELIYVWQRGGGTLARHALVYYRYVEPVVLALGIFFSFFVRGPGSAFIYFQF